MFLEVLWKIYAQPQSEARGHHVVHENNISACSPMLPVNSLTGCLVFSMIQIILAHIIYYTYYMMLFVSVFVVYFILYVHNFNIYK